MINYKDDKMIKKYILFFIAIMWSYTWSQSYKMTVILKDGTTASFIIQDIQKITFDGTVVVDSKDAEKLQNMVKMFMLFQNYPNPFNPITNIEYEIPKAGRVEIKIFNVTGQLIKSIKSEFQEAGVNKIIWDGKNDQGQPVSSGLYIYQVKFEDSILLKKMMLVK
ncbi:T9SS type A sorting domain-containing protein [candidate division KSB1 bacterium]|nr:T9SS type A sorting domain-containing protein [candidate division KSB1 bacterium]